MKYDTAGNKIIEPTQNCDCRHTGGCQKCNPLPSFIGCISDEEAEDMKSKIKEFRVRFDRDIKERNKNMFPEIKRKCINCGEELDDFCSRYCKIEKDVSLEI
uniref:Uncharacterized protein n=1 Tax=viral metagenome TaxID=1070528 RepID=A0A6H1ZQP5_9ZZZZ